MPRCRKSYRGSRSKAQVPGLSSFSLPIRSCRSFVSFSSVRPFVRSIDRSIDRSGNFILSAWRVRAYVFSRRRRGLVLRLMFQLTYVSRVPGRRAITAPSPRRRRRGGCQRESPGVPMFPNLNLLFLAKNSGNAQIQPRLPTTRVDARARNSYLFVIPIV